MRGSPGRGPAVGSVRVLRAAVLGGTSLLLATGAHVVGGGTLPGLGALLVAGVVLALVAALVTARRCGPVLLVAALGVQQVLLHLFLGLAAAAEACAPADVGGGHTAMLHASAPPVAACAATGGMAMSGALPGWAMLAAHAAATLATVWVLARGEAWCWRVVDRVVDAAGLRVGRRPTDRRPAAPAPSASSLRLAAAVWTPAAPRGPPLRATA